MIDINLLFKKLSEKGYNSFDGNINPEKNIINVYSSTLRGGRGNAIDFKISEESNDVSIYIQGYQEIIHKSISNSDVFDIISNLDEKFHRLQIIPISSEAKEMYFVNHAPKVGDVVSTTVKLLDNDIGSIGVVYQIYQDLESPDKTAASVIFQNGEYDGFSYHEMNYMLKYIYFEEKLSDYLFTNTMQLSDDFENGYWNYGFKYI
jgi:hypothetical protein